MSQQPKDLKIDMQVEIKGIPAGSKVPAEMVGTWFFDNPHGDEEQMAVFPDGRVVVLYSNGHKDKTNGPTYYRRALNCQVMFTQQRLAVFTFYA